MALNKSRSVLGRGKAGPRRDPLASLKMADMIILKPVMPAEIMAVVVDYMAVPDLLRFARASRRCQEMVYDETRWIRRLSLMGCWNETEAKRRQESAMAQGVGSSVYPGQRQNTIERNLVNGKGRPEIIFNADAIASPTKRKPAGIQIPDGFDSVQLSSPMAMTPGSSFNTDRILVVMKEIKSIRNCAREEYGKVYAALSPFYRDALTSRDPINSLIFRIFTEPEQQAQALSLLFKFQHSDFSPGSEARRIRLETVAGLFDAAALLEFRKGYEYKDIQGRMRKYAGVMHILNGGKNSIELFLHDNKMVAHKSSLGSIEDCIDYSMGHSQLSLERVHAYFERLGNAYVREAGVVQTVFPNVKEVLPLLLERVGKEILVPFLTALLQDARGRGSSTYLRIITGAFAASKEFIQNFALPPEPDDELLQRAKAVIAQVFEPYLEEYLGEELAAFQQRADVEVERWDSALSEQDANTENFLMSNVNRQADKKDFMTSFKKVVMMPVHILPSLSGSSISKADKRKTLEAPHSQSGRSTPNPLGYSRPVSPSLPVEAPTTELAAKAAVMTSKLDNIKSLFSLDVALNLVHAAKSSLERAAQFIFLGGSAGNLARAQCSTIFVTLLHAVGIRHVKAGFDKAIDHLSHYNPRSSSQDNSYSDNTTRVTPLATFLELVNVGDLIQQMLDVFFESELVRLGVTQRDDFLDVNVKEKRRFEAMLDERVAAGLGKGIDVLMDEAEVICATTQNQSDFNPAPGTEIDIRSTPTALRVIELIRNHTSMLTGATDKSLLDVFTAELGQRLFGVVCKHIKRQRISTAGALPLLCDLSLYANYIATFRNADLNSYFTALREVAQIYLIEAKTDKEMGEMATIISDTERYRGILTVEEVVEFAERRSDWLVVKSKVEGKVKGESCTVM